MSDELVYASDGAVCLACGYIHPVADDLAPLEPQRITCDNCSEPVAYVKINPTCYHSWPAIIPSTPYMAMLTFYALRFGEKMEALKK